MVGQTGGYTSLVEATFDRGDEQSPKGHALIYFRNNMDHEEIWATYVVILPIAVDVSKYVPPFLMDQVSQMGPKELSAFAFPPAPELLGDYGILEELSTRREDDILYCGTINTNDLPAAMMAINEVVQAYSEKYIEVVGIATAGGPSDEDEEDGGLSVNEVLYDLMNDSDKLGELTKLVGQLKFAVDGSNQDEIHQAEQELILLAKHLPLGHQVNQLVAAVKLSDSNSAKLADLYLQRCYCLVNEDYRKMAEIDEQLVTLESGGADT
mgnify:FL=1